MFIGKVAGHTSKTSKEVFQDEDNSQRYISRFDCVL